MPSTLQNTVTIFVKPRVHSPLIIFTAVGSGEIWNDLLKRRYNHSLSRATDSHDRPRFTPSFFRNKSLSKRF